MQAGFMYISDSTTRKYALSSTGFATTAANPSLQKSHSSVLVE